MGASSQAVLSCVYVGNVSSGVGQRELQSLFGQCGPIAELRVAGKPGFSTVYCFVHYYSQRDAEAALRLNGALVDSRAIKVSMAKQAVPATAVQPSRAPAVSSLRPWSAPPVPLPSPRVVSSQPANIIQAQAQARLMQLSALNMLVPAVASLPAPVPCKAKKAQQDPGKVRRTVFISKLPQDVPEQDLAKAFANFGAVTAVRVSQRKGHHAAQAWVELDNSAAASRACRSSTTVVLGGQVLAVQASQTAIHTSTLPCSGSSSPTRSPSSSHQGPVAASAAPPDAAASLKSTGSPNKPAMQPHRADCPDKPVIEPQKPSSPAASEHHAAGIETGAAAQTDAVRMKRPAPDATAPTFPRELPDALSTKLPDLHVTKRLRRAASF